MLKICENDIKFLKTTQQREGEMKQGGGEEGN